MKHMFASNFKNAVNLTLKEHTN